MGPGRFMVIKKKKCWKILKFLKFGTGLGVPHKCQRFSTYLMRLCDIDLIRKFDSFQIFYNKTEFFSFQSKFCIKNVFFWYASCSKCSTSKKVEGGFISCKCSLWFPLPISLFLSYYTMIYLKRTHFSCRIQIQMKKVFFMCKKLKETWGFLSPSIT